MSEEEENKLENLSPYDLLLEATKEFIDNGGVLLDPSKDGLDPVHILCIALGWLEVDTCELTSVDITQRVYNEVVSNKFMTAGEYVSFMVAYNSVWALLSNGVNLYDIARQWEHFRDVDLRKGIVISMGENTHVMELSETWMNAAFDLLFNFKNHIVMYSEDVEENQGDET